MADYEEETVTMTEDGLRAAALEGAWYPICPYCGAETPAEPDAHAVYCQACNQRFKILNPFFSMRKRYYGPYLSNWQYGGYSYIEEDTSKPEELWSHGMVDYADPDKVIALAEREGLGDISLAGGFWQQIGYQGWGQKVSISEAKTALSKAKEHILGSTGSNPWPPTGVVKCPLCEDLIEIPEYDRVTKSEALSQHIREKHGFRSGSGGPAIDEKEQEKINKVRTELEDLRDEAYNRHRGVRISDWVTSPESPGIVVNEERAKATACKCFTYKGKDYCYSPGIIGMLETGQVPDYCPTKEYEVRPGIKQRFQEFAEAAEEAHKRIEEIPKGERLVPWLTEMGKELRTRGIEV